MCPCPFVGCRHSPLLRIISLTVLGPKRGFRLNYLFNEIPAYFPVTNPQCVKYVLYTPEEATNFKPVVLNDRTWLRKIYKSFMTYLATWLGSTTHTGSGVQRITHCVYSTNMRVAFAQAYVSSKCQTEAVSRCHGFFWAATSTPHTVAHCYVCIILPLPHYVWVSHKHTPRISRRQWWHPTAQNMTTWPAALAVQTGKSLWNKYYTLIHWRV